MQWLIWITKVYVKNKWQLCIIHRLHSLFIRGLWHFKLEETLKKYLWLTVVNQKLARTPSTTYTAVIGTVTGVISHKYTHLCLIHELKAPTE